MTVCTYTTTLEYTTAPVYTTAAAALAAMCATTPAYTRMLVYTIVPVCTTMPVYQEANTRRIRARRHCGERRHDGAQPQALCVHRRCGADRHLQLLLAVRGHPTHSRTPPDPIVMLPAPPPPPGNKRYRPGIKKTGSSWLHRELRRKLQWLASHAYSGPCRHTPHTFRGPRGSSAEGSSGWPRMRTQAHVGTSFARSVAP